MLWNSQFKKSILAGGPSNHNIQAPEHSLLEMKLLTPNLKQFDGDYKRRKEYRESFETPILSAEYVQILLVDLPSD